MRHDESTRTPTEYDMVRSIIEAVVMDLNVCLPAKIVKYDAKTQMASVQPVLKTKYESGAIVEAPVIPNVPVKHPRGQGKQTFIHIPLKKDDDVTLVFSQRSLDNWKSQGGLTDPQDRRRMHLTDAIALIGGSAEPDAFTVDDPDSVEIVNKDGKIQIKPDGKINVGGYAAPKSAALGEAVEARLQKIENSLTTLVTEMTTFITAIYTTHTHIEVAVPGSPTAPPLPPGTPPSAFTPDTSEVKSSKIKVTE